MSAVSFWKLKLHKKEKGKPEPDYDYTSLPSGETNQKIKLPFPKQVHDGNPIAWSSPELLKLHRTENPSCSDESSSYLNPDSEGSMIASMQRLNISQNSLDSHKYGPFTAQSCNQLDRDAHSTPNPSSFQMKRGWSAPPSVAPTYLSGFSPIPGSGEFPRCPGLSSGDSRQNSINSFEGEIDEVTIAQVINLASEGGDAEKEQAAKGFWELSRNGSLTRNAIKSSGGIRPLVSLLSEPNEKTIELAVRALANLSISDELKIAIPAAGAIPILIRVLKTGSSDARANAAATLYSLSKLDVNKIVVGEAGAITPLVELLTFGNPQGRKDAATALFNLSIYKENKTKILEAGGVPPLLAAMQHEIVSGSGDSAFADKVVAVLANLVTSADGRTEIVRHKGVVCLCEMVQVGSPAGKEFATAALLLLWQNCHSDIHRIIRDQGIVDELLLLQSEGTSRAKLKATALLKLIRQSIN